MQRIAWLFLLFLGPAVFAQQSTSPPELAGRRVLILGDSITAGGGYVSFMEYLLLKHAPEERFDFISVGLGSETASGLSEKDHPFPRPCVHSRVDRALELTKPEIVFACYGMNDGIYHPPTPRIERAYQEGIRSLVGKIEKAGARAVILTPPPFDPVPKRGKLAKPGATDWSYKAPHADYHKVLEGFAAWILEARPGDHQVDLNAAVNRALAAARETDANFTFARDGIHPNAEGHLIMARAILESFGLPTGEENLAEIQADPLFKQADARRRLRSGGWLNHIGYTRGKTVGPAPLGDTEENAAKMMEAMRASPER